MEAFGNDAFGKNDQMFHKPNRNPRIQVAKNIKGFYFFFAFISSMQPNLAFIFLPWKFKELTCMYRIQAN